jgi:hypothetical protein
VLLEQAACVFFDDSMEVFVSACEGVERVGSRWAEIVRGGGKADDLEDELEWEFFEGGHLAVLEVVVGRVWVCRKFVEVLAG